MMILYLLTVRADLPCGFTSHFQLFLAKAYSQFRFENNQLKCAQFGGKANSDVKIKRTPIVFIHGNSDIAFGRGIVDGYKDWQTGFRKLAEYFTSQQNYTSSQMYTFTWGNGNDSLAYKNYHKKDELLSIRAFLKAVIEYTNATQINVIGHSMGVTYLRKAIKGGQAKDQNQGSYDLGPSISQQIGNFFGIAGANLGLNACYDAPTLPTCSRIDGFYPGLTALSGPSTFLADLKSGGSQGGRVFTIWSSYDDLIGSGCLVFGKVTCRIQNQQGQVSKNEKEWSHFKLRDDSGPDIWALLKNSPSFNQK